MLVLNLTRGYTDELAKVCFALLRFVQLCFVPLCFPFVRLFSRRYVKVLPGFYKSRVLWRYKFMKSEAQIFLALNEVGKGTRFSKEKEDAIRETLEWVLE